MSDIVERLKARSFRLATRDMDGDGAKLALEAAEEITALRAFLAAREADRLEPAGLLDPEMPAQTMRLHMGEVTAQEMRTARAAIRWANTRIATAIRTLAKDGEG